MQIPDTLCPTLSRNEFLKMKLSITRKKTHGMCVTYYLQLLSIMGSLEHHLLLQLNGLISLTHQYNCKIVLNHRGKREKSSRNG